MSSFETVVGGYRFGEETGLEPVVGVVIPKLSLEELHSKRFDPDIVAAFAGDLLAQVAEAVGEDLNRLRDNEAHGLRSIAESRERWCSPDLDGPAISIMTYKELVFQIGYNMPGLIDPDWLEENQPLLAGGTQN